MAAIAHPPLPRSSTPTPKVDRPLSRPRSSFSSPPSSFHHVSRLSDSNIHRPPTPPPKSLPSSRPLPIPPRTYSLLNPSSASPQSQPDVSGDSSSSSLRAATASQNSIESIRTSLRSLPSSEAVMVVSIAPSEAPKIVSHHSPTSSAGSIPHSPALPSSPSSLLLSRTQFAGLPSPDPGDRASWVSFGLPAVPLPPSAFYRQSSKLLAPSNVPGPKAYWFKCTAGSMHAHIWRQTVSVPLPFLVMLQTHAILS